MTPLADRLILPDVPRANENEHPDTYLETLSIAARYGDADLEKRFPFGVYPHLSGYTGRGWLIGFDDARYYWEKHATRSLQTEFPVTGLDANLRIHETLGEAIAHLGYAPRFIRNTDSRFRLDAGAAPAFLVGAETADRSEIRRYVMEYLSERRKPVVCFLYSPQVPVVEAALLTGYDAAGEVILGSSRYQAAPAADAPDFGYFRLSDWERDVVLIAGLGDEAPPEARYHPCYTAIENALRYSESYTDGTRHYGLAAYDAWRAALLDDAGTLAGDDLAVSRRLLYHSSVAGSIACQKAFTAFPDYWRDVPSNGVINGLLQRAAAGSQMVHGLMWDAWQVAGGYWRGIEPEDSEFHARWTNLEEVERFKDHSVRERVAAVVTRAKRTDEESLDYLRQAKLDWDLCRGHGGSHPCPCWGEPCTRV